MKIAYYGDFYATKRLVIGKIKNAKSNKEPIDNKTKI